MGADTVEDAAAAAAAGRHATPATRWCGRATRCTATPSPSPSGRKTRALRRHLRRDRRLRAGPPRRGHLAGRHPRRAHRRRTSPSASAAATRSSTPTSTTATRRCATRGSTPASALDLAFRVAELIRGLRLTDAGSAHATALDLVADGRSTTSRPRSSRAGDGRRHDRRRRPRVPRSPRSPSRWSAWAMLVAVEEGIARPRRSRSASRAARCATCSPTPAATRSTAPTPIGAAGRRRIYSNTGFELAADELSRRGRHAVRRVPAEAVFEPLGMTSTELRGSPAHGVDGTRRRPGPVRRRAAAADADRRGAPRPTSITVQFPALAGIVPGVGRFDPCPWGLGFEVRGDKQPHWTGTTPTRRARSATSAAPARSSGSIPTLDVGARRAHRPRVRRVADEALELWPAALRRRGRRAAAGRRDVQPGDRVRWETTGDDGLPLVRYGFVGGCHRRRRSDRRDARRRARRRRGRPRPARAGARSPTSSSRLDGADLLDDPSLRQGLVNLWAAEADRPGSRSARSSCIGTGVRDSSGFALAELWAGSEQYVLRASADTASQHDPHQGRRPAPLADLTASVASSRRPRLDPATWPPGRPRHPRDGCGGRRGSSRGRRAARTRASRAAWRSPSRPDR